MIADRQFLKQLFLHPCPRASHITHEAPSFNDSLGTVRLLFTQQLGKRSNRHELHGAVLLLESSQLFGQFCVVEVFTGHLANTGIASRFK